MGLKGLEKKLKLINDYLIKIEEGTVTPDNQIIFNLQEILNIMPKLDEDKKLKAFQSKTNDNYFTIYVSSIVRAIISLHDLINNKLNAKRLELQRIADKNKEKEDKAKKEAEKAEGNEKDKKDKETPATTEKK